MYIYMHLHVHRYAAGKIPRCYLLMLLLVRACWLKLLASLAGLANHGVLAGTADPFGLSWTSQAWHGLARPACQGGQANAEGKRTKLASSTRVASQVCWGRRRLEPSAVLHVGRNWRSQDGVSDRSFYSLPTSMLHMAVALYVGRATLRTWGVLGCLLGPIQNHIWFVMTTGAYI